MIPEATDALNHCTAYAMGPEGLSGIHRPGIATAVWERTPLSGL